ncbi:MAG: hypothetical protein IGS03_16515 [Candidatus Sericytochromatia bacterium]|nr:hypothetical protein [Candidatus Sericytochromatia bacterium]
MIDYAHREQFRNKLSSVAFSAKSMDLNLSDEIQQLVNAYNQASDPPATMAELIEAFWARPEAERVALIEAMKAVEVQIQEQQQSEFSSDEGFNLFDD